MITSHSIHMTRTSVADPHQRALLRPPAFIDITERCPDQRGSSTSPFVAPITESYSDRGICPRSLRLARAPSPRFVLMTAHLPDRRASSGRCAADCDRPHGRWTRCANLLRTGQPARLFGTGVLLFAFPSSRKGTHLVSMAPMNRIPCFDSNGPFWSGKSG
jgi:hypothetical protein